MSLITSSTKPDLPLSYRLVTFTDRSEADLLDQIGVLRAKVWRASGFPMTIKIENDRWFDDGDAASLHLAVLNKENTLIAASRLTIYSKVADLMQGDWFNQLTDSPTPPIAFISRLVVDPDKKRAGLGYFLDTECIRIAREKGAGSVFCDVPEYRIDGLKRMGFRLVQEPKFGEVFPTLKWAAMLLPLKA